MDELRSATSKEREALFAELRREREVDAAHRYHANAQLQKAVETFAAPAPVLSPNTRAQIVAPRMAPLAAPAPVGTSIRSALAPVKPWGDDSLV